MRRRFLEVLRKHGAELVLHGHHHVSSLVWLSGPRYTIPCVGVPSASCARGYHDDPAGYNLYEIDGEPGAWRCTHDLARLQPGERWYRRVGEDGAGGLAAV